MDEKKLLEYKRRGYLTPEDFEGSDREKLQAALSLAAKEDIGKVLIGGELNLDGTVAIPAGMELKLLAGARVRGSADPLFVNGVSLEPEKASWSFEDKWIYLLGERDSEIQGNLAFFHAGNLVFEDLKIKGSVTFEFCREVRMERCEIASGQDSAVTLLRGCNNYIMQYNRISAKRSAVLADASLEKGPYVMGKDAEIHELIIRENTLEGEAALFIGASEESGVFNVQYDHTKSSGIGVVIGHEGESLDKKRYFNLTATDFEGTREEKLLRNEVKHCFFGE